MIGSRHLKMAGRFARLRLRELHPFEVQANLMNACNLRCVYCRCPEMKTDLLETDQWRAIIRRLGELGTIRIKFQGGEPTLRPDFRELCVEAKASGMITAVTSHGQAIASKPHLLDALDELVISLDSPNREVNDRLRGAGTFDRAVRAIDLALGRGVRAFVNMVVVSHTLGEIEQMLEFCEARGIMMHAQPVMFDQEALFGVYSDETAKDLSLTDEEIRAMHQRIVAWKRQGRPLLFSSWAYEKAIRWPDFERANEKSQGLSECMAGSDYIHIEPNGDVHPCGMHGADFTPKNAAKDGLDEALRHARIHNCGDCWLVYLNERKALFGLKPGALWQVFRRG